MDIVLTIIFLIFGLIIIVTTIQMLPFLTNYFPFFRYPNPRYRLEVLNFMPPNDGLLRIEAGEMGPIFHKELIEKWKQIKIGGAKMKVIFGPTLQIDRKLYDALIEPILKNGKKLSHEWLKCHPVLDAALLQPHNRIELYFKTNTNTKEIHYMLLNDRGKTTLVEDTHGVENPGEGVIYRYRPDKFQEWSNTFERRLEKDDPKYCEPMVNYNDANRIFHKIVFEPVDLGSEKNNRITTNRKAMAL